MTVIIKHNAQSTIPDQNVPGEIGPSEWNDVHAVSGVAQNSFLVGSGINGGVIDRPLQGVDLMAPTVNDRGGVFSTDFRPVRNAAGHYYVRKDGSDGNSGLANNAGGAFLTWQKAIDVASMWDFGFWDTTIHIGPGSGPNVWTAPIIVRPYVSNGGRLIIEGDVTTPANVTLDVTNAFAVYALNVVYFWLRGIKIITRSAGYSGIYLDRCGLDYDQIEWGACGQSNIYGSNRSMTNQVGPCIISGNAQGSHITLSRSAASTGAQQITLANTPNFGAPAQLPATPAPFVYITDLSHLSCNNMTFPGTGAVSSRYYADFNSVINTNGASTLYFPGSAAGQTVRGGIYA